MRTSLRAGLATALLLWVAGSLRAQDSWVALGPIGEVGNEGIAGRVISLAVDPRNPNHVFAGSASGGLWVSELSDPGKGGPAADDPREPREANWRDPKRPYWRWRYVDTGFPVLGVGAIAIDPKDPDVVYIGTGEVYGYRRTTRGFDNQPTRGNYGIGILRSVDGGRSWTRSLDLEPQGSDGRAGPPDRARARKARRASRCGPPPPKGSTGWIRRKRAVNRAGTGSSRSTWSRRRR